MGEFRFKRFVIMNERSAMKVNTDGVLLGAAMTIKPSDRTILDIGTGTGTIALMAAQRLSDLIGTKESEGFGAEDVSIVGIDIDEPSATEAGQNFARSPWHRMLSSQLASLQNFTPSRKIDLICSNPPYFENSLKAPQARRSSARHTDTLSYRDILIFASRFLSDDGRVAMVLPSETEYDLCRVARSYSLFPFRIVRVRTVERKQPCRIIAEFSRERVEVVEQEHIIQDKGKLTSQHLALVGDFLCV